MERKAGGMHRGRRLEAGGSRTHLALGDLLIAVPARRPVACSIRHLKPLHPSPFTFPLRARIIRHCLPPLSLALPLALPPVTLRSRSSLSLSPFACLSPCPRGPLVPRALRDPLPLGVGPERLLVLPAQHVRALHVAHTGRGGGSGGVGGLGVVVKIQGRVSRGALRRVRSRGLAAHPRTARRAQWQGGEGEGSG
ncbi:unnamed protein product [Closterium sp. NIES-54]